ncbi:MAG: hypothetical protein CFE44_12425 [Burkholderiales bacterium PBB4]|nr:MAG: hypothetical protein CFE44_12425 [Burkholderiales bacterium PBB4]
MNIRQSEESVPSCLRSSPRTTIAPLMPRGVDHVPQKDALAWWMDLTGMAHARSGGQATHHLTGSGAQPATGRRLRSGRLANGPPGR